MIICVCNNINCKSVRAAVSAGASCPTRVQRHHGCKFQCGKCRSSIGDIISDETLKASGAAAIAAE